MGGKHLGRDATNRLILTKDKTLVHGSLLIDDKPRILGAVKPRWKTSCSTRPTTAK